MTSLAVWSIATGPLLLLTVALWPRANERPRAVARAALAAATAGLATAAAAVVAVAALGPLRTPAVAAIGAPSLQLDALSATVFALIAFIGVIVVRYSDHYLSGDERQGVFLQRLCRTIAAVMMLVLAGDLVVLAAAWIGTSLSLHQLLLFYPERRAAVLAARKKFVASRAGDACVVGAAALLFAAFGAVDYETIGSGAHALAAAGTAPPGVHAAAALLVCAALLKSAQFPLHGWLLEVMETPTPVSGLLHAGIVNAGGFLLLRLADVVLLSAAALDALAIAAAITALFASLVLLTQTSTKVSLAFSTVAQMGFMLLQIGLGAFSAALLHLVAHSLYKAHAFLAAGNAAADVAHDAPTARPRAAAVAAAVFGAGVAACAVAIALGSGPTERPGTFALGAIVAIGIALSVARTAARYGTFHVVGSAVLAAAGTTALYLALQRGAAMLLDGTLPAMRAVDGAAVALAVGVVAAFTAIAALQGMLGAARPPRALRTVYVHLANGLYVNTFANRLAVKLWPAPPSRRTS